jgi:hypothetical protein
VSRFTLLSIRVKKAAPSLCGEGVSVHGDLPDSADIGAKTAAGRFFSAELTNGVIFVTH